MTKKEVLELMRTSVDDEIAALRDHSEKEWAEIRIEQLKEAMQEVEKALLGGDDSLIPLPARYSGYKSRGFWAEVHKLKGKERDAAYAMGCMLQDLETRVIRYVNEKRGVL